MAVVEMTGSVLCDVENEWAGAVWMYEEMSGQVAVWRCRE